MESILSFMTPFLYSVRKVGIPKEDLQQAITLIRIQSYRKWLIAVIRLGFSGPFAPRKEAVNHPGASVVWKQRGYLKKNLKRINQLVAQQIVLVYSYLSKCNLRIKRSKLSIYFSIFLENSQIYFMSNILYQTN